MKWNAKDKSPADIKKILNDAWLNVIIEEHTIFNPLMSMPKNIQDNEHLYILHLMSQPEYFSFFCSEILGINLLPFQLVIQEELWRRKFPMLVGSRGCGKTFSLALYALLRAVFIPGRKIVIAGAGFRQSKLVFDYIVGFWNNSPLLRDFLGGASSNGPKFNTDTCKFTLNESTILAIPVGCLHPDTLVTTNTGVKTIKQLKNSKDLIWSNGKYREIGFFYDSGVSPAIKVTTSNGYEYIGTPNHKMKVCRNSQIIWVRTDEMIIGDRILIDRTDRWHNGKFECSDEAAYSLGLMLGDGNFTNPAYLRYTTIDYKFLDSLNVGIGQFKEDSGDDVHFNLFGKKIVSEWLKFWNLKPLYSYQKYLPDTILSSSKSNIAACISGLFDTDGHLAVCTSKGGTGCSVNYTTTSKLMVTQVQYLLTHFGIISSVRFRDRLSPRTGNKAHRVYELMISGRDVVTFRDKIGFRLTRKKQALNDALSNKTRFMSYTDDIPCDFSLLPKSVTKDRKIFTFDRYRKTKKIIKSEKVLELCNENIYYDKIESIEKVEDQLMYDINVPDNNEYTGGVFYSHNTGDKIRGIRSHDLIIDEFSSHSEEIFENVLVGFGAVSSSPQLSVQKRAKEYVAKQLGIEILSEDDDVVGNQMILSGTAYYYFNHFYKYWQKWKTIIESQGDINKLKLIYPNGIPPGFDHRHYSIMRIPIEIIPKGFMDDGQIARSKATLHSGLFNMEYSAVFSVDSQGFFRAALIHSCVCDHKNLIEKTGYDEPIIYKPRITGDASKEYVFAIDPASEQDNFALTIIELHENHRRIVYCWTTNSSDFKEKRKSGVIQETDFYGFCARHIRNLMKTFPTKHIAIDSQGGGKAVSEALHDKDKVQPGEELIWEIIEPGVEKDTDGEEGLHIVHLINFAKEEFTSGANHGMKKDFEDKVLLFPAYDISYLAIHSELKEEGFNDAVLMEDCILEIEELKKELTQIIVTATTSGRERFDTPEVKISGGEKGRLRKDRYSSLLMANWVARRLTEPLNYEFSIGGFAGYMQKQSGSDFIGPAWLTKQLNGLYD